MPGVKIVRLAPGEGRIDVDWVVQDPDDRETYFEVHWKRRGESWDSARAERVEPAKPSHRGSAITSTSTTIAGVENGIDYELRVQRRKRDSGDIVAESATRLARPGHVPGVVVNYNHPDDYTYNSSGRSTASPSIAELPDGRLVASHDIYWDHHGQNLSMIFRSDDRGKTWRFVCELHPCFWGKLFVHRGALYMLSTSTEYGALIIRRSEDGGETWSSPTKIIPAGSRERGGPHKAPVPVVEHRGRLWSAVEYGSWALGGHDAGVVSVPVDADLLDPKAWAVTPFLKYDPSWPGTIEGGTNPGVLEGNIVVTPEGDLVNVLRYHTVGGKPDYGKAIILNVNADDPWAPLTFRQVIDFPGNMSKFTIHYDPVSKHYWSLVNRVTTPVVTQRNVLTLTRSRDLVHWEIVTDILNYQDNGWPEDLTKVGFQYLDWIFDGDDIAALSRTAINGPWNYHNANHITFHRIENFRSL